MFIHTLLVCNSQINVCDPRIWVVLYLIQRSSQSVLHDTINVRWNIISVVFPTSNNHMSILTWGNPLMLSTDSSLYQQTYDGSFLNVDIKFYVASKLLFERLLRKLSTLFNSIIIQSIPPRKSHFVIFLLKPVVSQWFSLSQSLISNMCILQKIEF